MEKSLIIFAALLVATVAGQAQDAPLKSNKDDILTSKLEPSNYGNRKLLGHPLERSLIYGNSLNVPCYLKDDIFDVSVIPFEEVIIQPLFQEYMKLPYFRQYWSYPMFQCYVASEYFQRFWLLPSFQNYFVNPALFYKYIYPLVNIYKDDMSTDTTTPNKFPLDGKWPLTLRDILPEAKASTDVPVTPKIDSKVETAGITANPITSTSTTNVNLTTPEAKHAEAEEPKILVENMDKNSSSEKASLIPTPTESVYPEKPNSTPVYAPYYYGRFPTASSPFVPPMI